MAVVTFNSDQLMAMLGWLEDQRDAGSTLEDVIEGLERGYLSARVTVTDKRFGSNTSLTKSSEDVLRVSEEV